MDFFLPEFWIDHSKKNLGSPTVSKTKLKRAELSSIDIVGVTLWYLKTRYTAYYLCLVFGSLRYRCKFGFTKLWRYFWKSSSTSLERIFKIGSQVYEKLMHQTSFWNRTEFQWASWIIYRSIWCSLNEFFGLHGRWYKECVLRRPHVKLRSK